MNKAYKFRIYPNSEQEDLLAKTFGCVRFVYNHMLSDKIAHYEETGKILKTTPAQYKGEYPFLKEVDSLALCNAQLHLETAYYNFFRDKSVGFPKFKSRKDNRRTYTTNVVNGNIKLIDGYIVLPKLKAVKIKQHRIIPEDSILRSVTIIKTPTDKYFASLLYELEHNLEPVKPEKVVGLDFSMKELYASSDGTVANYPKFYHQAEDRLAKAQKTLSRRTQGSKRYDKQKRKVALLHEKIANQRKDFIHKQTRQIANAYDAVAVEDLNMKDMSQSLHFGKGVHDNGWGMFTRMLEYKLLEQGKQLVKVNKWYPSSKTCSICGAVKDDLPLGVRIYTCQCGNVLDRDYNASINIREEGMRLLTT